MLKMKHHKKEAFKMISSVVNDGMRVAENKIVDMRSFVQPGLQEVQGRITTHPISTGLAIIGFGLAIIGSLKLLRK